MRSTNQKFMTGLTNLIKNEITFLMDERNSVRKRSNYKYKETYAYSLWTLRSKIVSNRRGKRVWILRFQFTEWQPLVTFFFFFSLTELQLQFIKSKSLLYKRSFRLQKQKEDAYLITDMLVSCGKTELHHFGENTFYVIFTIFPVFLAPIYIYIYFRYAYCCKAHNTTKYWT